MNARRIVCGPTRVSGAVMWGHSVEGPRIVHQAPRSSVNGLVLNSRNPVKIMGNSPVWTESEARCLTPRQLTDNLGYRANPP